VGSFGPKVLLVSTPSRFRDAVRDALVQAEYTVFEADSIDYALDALHRERFAVVVASQVVGSSSGTDLLRRAKGTYPSTVVALLDQGARREHHDDLDVAIRMPVPPAAIADRLRAFVPAQSATALAQRREAPTREIEVARD